MFREKRLYVDRLVKMSDELAEIFRILKIGVPLYDVKLEPSIQRGISAKLDVFQWVEW